MPFDNEADLLRVQVDLVIDRTTGFFRWSTHGMSTSDFKEQDIVYRCIAAILTESRKASEQESKTIQ